MVSRLGCRSSIFSVMLKFCGRRKTLMTCGEGGVGKTQIAIDIAASRGFGEDLVPLSK